MPGYLSRQPALSSLTCPMDSNLQSAGSRLGTDLGLHGILRGFPGSVSWHACCGWRLWIQGLDFIRSCREDEEAKCRVGKWSLGNDGDHRHVLSGKVYKFPSTLLRTRETLNVVNLFTMLQVDNAMCRYINSDVLMAHNRPKTQCFVCVLLWVVPFFICVFA